MRSGGKNVPNVRKQHCPYGLVFLFCLRALRNCSDMVRPFTARGISDGE